MVYAFVLINCHFPFDKQILEKLKHFSAIQEVYRTQGIYDLILKIRTSSEVEFKEIMGEISRMNRVNSTETLIINNQEPVLQASSYSY